jgi:hypothetical protein
MELDMSFSWSGYTLTKCEGVTSIRIRRFFSHAVPREAQRNAKKTMGARHL